jgi:23S rRNA maturation mini-RNase III
MQRDTLINEARTIVKQIRNGEMELTPEARTLKVTREIGRDGWGRTKSETHVLATFIANQVANFVLADTIQVTETDTPHLEDYERTILRSKKFSRLHEISCELIDAIEYARAHGLLKIVGIENLKKEVEQLQERLDVYEKENLELKEENKNLHTLVKNLGGESTSDVESGG